jgi:iron complex transport system permease protein
MPKRENKRLGIIFVFSITIIAIVVLTLILLCTGAVKIPIYEVFNVLTGGTASKHSWEIIMMESRLPMAITAILAGSGLSVAGLLMQTIFRNPLAGPSVLGVSSGASLGVAIVMLSSATIFHDWISASASGYIGALIGALVGAGSVLLLLLLFSSVLRNSVLLLIVGMMVSYLTSSVISLLNFFAAAEGVKSFVVWGLGSYSSVLRSQLPVFSLLTILLLISSWFFAKPLNALLLGDRYAENLGYSIKRLRALLLIVSGSLTAIITSFCGPIGFLGLVVPHIARMLIRSSDHFILIPMTAVCGIFISLLCATLSVVPSAIGVIPINAITPIVGVPVILYIILNRKRLNYFN